MESLSASWQLLPRLHPSKPTPDLRAARQLTHAKRVKSGDALTAHLVAPAKLPNGTELQKGTKLVGTITDVKPKADKEGPSKMGLLFTTAASRWYRS